MNVTSTTPKILKLVRDGRATPRDAAVLIELRGLVAAKRQRAVLRKHPVLNVAALVGLFVLSFFGFQRED